MVSKCPAFHYQAHSSLRIIIWYEIQLREIFHLILAGGVWSRSPATFPVPVAGQRLAPDYVAQTQSEDCLTHCCHRCCPRHKCNPIVIILICPRLLLLVKGELSFVESHALYLWYRRFHFHPAITDWKRKKQLSLTKDTPLFPSVYSDK